MRRQTLGAGLFLGLIALVADQSAFGQPAGPPDRIYYRDARADGVIKDAKGELKETAPGIFQIISGGKPIADGKIALELTGADIVRIIPGADMPGLPLDRLLNVDGMETGKDHAKAKAKYEEILNAPDLRQPAKRWAETRYNLLRARILESADDETRRVEGAQLATDLDQFLKTYPKGWELWPMGRALARLKVDDGKYGEAAATWAMLAASENLTRDLKDEAALREIDALIREGKFEDASRKCATLAQNAPASAGGKDRLAIFTAASTSGASDPTAAVRKIEEVIAKTKDPLARASGYAMIGELNMAAKKYREAMWAYLWVEVVFNQDRDEVLNAMSRLVSIFESLGEKERSDTYKERIRKYRSEA